MRTRSPRPPPAYHRLRCRTNPLSSPVVVDGIVSEEKLAELLALQAEYPELDYKETIDLSTTGGMVELAKDVGAMRVCGGYMLGGVDGNGGLTGQLDNADPRPFDEANLKPKLLRYLSQPLELRTSVIEHQGHRVAMICVLPSAEGCTFFCADGKYERNGKEKVVFREGDVFWRDGTRSVRVGQQGFEEIVERRIATQKEDWIKEQQEIRRRERTELEAARVGRELAEAPLGSVHLDLDSKELSLAALDFVRRGDTVALRHLLNDAASRARALIERDDIESGLADLLDRVTCLAAAFLEYEQRDWLERVIDLLVETYAMPLREGDVRRFGLSTAINPNEPAPRVWLLVTERVFGLGALAVRRNRWDVVRELTLQLPEPIARDGYDTNWLRHTLTMASRAQKFEHEETQKTSLLTLARTVVTRLECLRPDAPDDEAVLTSLAQFDILSNLVAIDDAGTVEGRAFYPNFARFRQWRIQRAVERLLTDPALRGELFKRRDDDLAIALAEIGSRASDEGLRYDGFESWADTPVGEFIAQHLPDEPRAS
ncbi:MAG: hypothetical protein H0T97_02935 [Actinobacteria bacterium]|nr:hypothetical protein [Actinomycetota bacterium]